MKIIKSIIFFCALLTLKASAQEFNKSINKDSLLTILVKNIPNDKKDDFIKAYHTGSEKDKEFLLFVLSMPRSSKKELIANIDSNYGNIYTLKSEYTKLVPKNFNVRIEFNPANNIVSTKEDIDIMILEVQKDGNRQVTQDWNLTYNSPKLNKMLALLKWNLETLKTIKKLLTNAKCVSIENDEITTVGFARSGMGKYSYLIFDNDLSPKQIKAYTDGCGNIFYKQNIVLLFEGGAVGTQCFPD
ncbi:MULTISPECIES: hypothetical protein [unclassified Mucilaginibacter]|uniref:hypothetical protein n=1 Tax=unclassified Mucilaginibacter TaxID=2617802 RepID=UPI002AC91EBC|nr:MULTISPECIES: hypothetical protein [unclassified Mucilaginibacter]MEB0262093.1 hypothetical protein [Mucilaginibacter sp. 10I4]MEB0278797.1 hypothetical protein [Mucilaginibacter sp. 10B2]MEB0299838.1 hypothetical protein [Mucilaginibacter sp. 5C4]WPX21980.1 hypothetical protein RHM67_11880 [Mucilaginibacter sp. 5C4]